MTVGTDRIWFPGNPWPNGHRIAEFRWSGWLDPDDGLRFGFWLESADYHADDPPATGDDDPVVPFGRSRHTWLNYGRCTIRPSMGFVAGTPAEPLDLDTLTDRTFVVDPPDEVADFEDDDEFAFHLYLLGHDSVADHRIRFPQRHGPVTFAVAWTGRIALTDIGEQDFSYEFRAQVGAAELTGIRVPGELDDTAAADLLGRCLRNAAGFELTRDGDTRRFVPTG